MLYKFFEIKPIRITWKARNRYFPDSTAIFIAKIQSYFDSSKLFTKKILCCLTYFRNILTLPLSFRFFPRRKPQFSCPEPHPYILRSRCEKSRLHFGGGSSKHVIIRIILCHAVPIQASAFNLTDFLFILKDYDTVPVIG